MKYLVTLGLVLAAGCSSKEERPFYVGTWQSNEAKTLESMAKAEGVPDIAKKSLRDNFYGRLVNVIREDSFTTYFIDQKPENPTYIDAEIEIIGPNKVRMKYFHQQQGETLTRELTIEDDCYTIPVVQWGFNEYFCRVD